MNAPDPALNIQLNAAEPQKPVDLLILMRGGATDVITTIMNLPSLQDKLPHHITDYRPYILADSAGAYPAYGLVAPSASNPLRPLFDARELPEIFTNHVRDYLAKDRQQARARLVQQAGQDVLVNQALTPICLSSVKISGRMRTSYFKYFPQEYLQQRPGFITPYNNNTNASLADAVLASSAFPAFLGDYKTQLGTRHIDMAFVENHAPNLSEFAMASKAAGRDVICVVFGNNYLDFNMDENADLKIKHVKHFFPDAIRAFIHDSLIDNCKILFGEKNVFDLSLRIPQDFNQKDSVSLPHAFRSDPAAIHARMNWTRRTLLESAYHHETIQRLANAITENCVAVTAPSTQFDFSYKGPAFSLETAALSEPPMSRRQHMAAEFATQAAPVAQFIGETVKPVVERTKPVLAAGAHLVEAGAKMAGTWLNTTWRESTLPWLTRNLDSIDRKLLPNTKRPEGDIRQLLQTRSSEPHTPSESDYTPL